MNDVVKIIAVVGLLCLPFGLVEGIWSEPSLRGFARKFDGSRLMWVLFFIYYAIIISVFLLKSRSDKK